MRSGFRATYWQREPTARRHRRPPLSNLVVRGLVVTRHPVIPRNTRPRESTEKRATFLTALSTRTRTPGRAVLPRTANESGNPVPLRTRGNPIAVPLWLAKENHPAPETRPGPLNRTEALSATVVMNAAILPEHALCAARRKSLLARRETASAAGEPPISGGDSRGAWW